MTKVFDIIVDKTTKELNRYGSTYKLVNISKKDNQPYYEYKAPGVDTLIVVPIFRQEWESAKKLFAKAGKGKTKLAYSQFIKTYVDKNFTSEDTEDDDGKPVTIFTALYKDIRLEIVFDGEGLSLVEAFTIVKNNIFDDDIRVDFQGEEE